MILESQCKVAVVIPSFKVTRHILDVIGGIGPECTRIYVVDDHCPDESGAFVRANCSDPRVIVLRNEVNQGVGGAVMAGYKAAIDDGMDVIVKVDGDGQMNAGLIPEFVAPIIAGEADYTKGNRFFDLEEISNMPPARLFGNAVLSFLTKMSSGYWDLFDPTNGFTAIHRDVAKRLPMSKISRRYFFETDVLFRLSTLRAVVVDIPMVAVYGDEVSHLKISRIVGEFLVKHIRNFVKRIFYNYYLRDMSIASIELPLGLSMMAFGMIFGGYHWIGAIHNKTPTPGGTIMLAALSLLMGLQFVLAFIAFDVASVPRRSMHMRMAKMKLRVETMARPTAP